MLVASATSFVPSSPNEILCSHSKVQCASSTAAIFRGKTFEEPEFSEKNRKKQSFPFGKVIQEHPLKFWPKPAQNERIDQSKQKSAIVLLKKNQMGGNLKVLDLS